MTKRIRVTSDDGTHDDLPFPDVPEFVWHYLDGLAPANLRDLVVELMALAPDCARIVEARAAASATHTRGSQPACRPTGADSGSGQDAESALAIDLENRVVDAIGDIGPGPDDDDYYDDRPYYDDPPGTGDSIDEVLEELQRHIAAGLLAVGRRDDDVDAERSLGRQPVNQMLVELADLDGDVDRAVALLQRGEPDTVGIARRLADEA